MTKLITSKNSQNTLDFFTAGVLCNPRKKFLQNSWPLIVKNITTIITAGLHFYLLFKPVYLSNFAGIYLTSSINKSVIQLKRVTHDLSVMFLTTVTRLALESNVNKLI